MRGHSSLHGATDAEWRLTSDASGEKTVTLEKLKDGSDRLQWSFLLKQMHLVAGTVEDDEVVTISTCVVEPASEPNLPDQDVPKVKGNDGIVLDTIADLCRSSTGKNSTSAKDAGVSRAAVQDLAIANGLGDSNNLKSQKTMVNRCLLSLSSKGLIGLDGDTVWLF